MTLTGSGTTGQPGIYVTAARKQHHHGNQLPAHFREPPDPRAPPTPPLNNKVRKISGNQTGTILYGINVAGGTTITVANNYISELYASAATGTNAISALYIGGGTTVNAYYNTIHLNATSSSATTFGTTGLYAITTSTVDLRNNIVINKSTRVGATAFTVAYRRSTTTLTSFAATSNNNAWYAGTPSAANLIFHDGTNSDSTISLYRTRVSTREANAVSEDPPFLNSTTQPYNLHLDPTIATRCESGAGTIAGYDTDYDGDYRFGHGSYLGLGTAPDIGADEGEFTFLGCSGTPTGGTAVITPTVICSGSSAISAAGASSDVGITYQWEESDDNGGSDPWANAVGGSGATSTTYTTPGYTAPIWYRCKVTCTFSSQTANGASVQFKPGLNGTYTINSGSSTGGTNFQTFAAARRGGLNVVSASGPYTEQVSLGQIYRANYTDSLSINGNFQTLQATPTAGNAVLDRPARCQDHPPSSDSTLGLIAIRDSSSAYACRTAASISPP
ncbi:MAG: hypothetical protein IPP94_12615 [Ignavibacteria bacterium]|nr:hypothetical protein [Ignavibacteria bacterium]